jgi:hypothetical protein
MTKVKPFGVLASIGDYIETFYNPLRRHSHRNSLNPIEYELRARVAALAP